MQENAFFILPEKNAAMPQETSYLLCVQKGRADR
jgi:hypothetical protein